MFTSKIALYVKFIIRCCNYMVSCASKDAFSKYNNTVLVFCDGANLIKIPAKYAHQQCNLHLVLLFRMVNANAN